MTDSPIVPAPAPMELAPPTYRSLPATTRLLEDVAYFDTVWRAAQMFANSGLVPPGYQGKPEACMVAILYAEQLGESWMTVFQGVYTIKGRPGTTAKFAIARANTSGLLAGPITYESEGTGENLVVTATGTIASTGERCSVSVSMQEAIADGWASANPKYRSMPEQMLRMRAASRFVNLYIPECLFGLAAGADVEAVDVQDVSPTRQPGAPAASQGGALDALEAQIEQRKATAPTPKPEPEKPKRKRRTPAPEQAQAEAPTPEPSPQAGIDVSTAKTRALTEMLRLRNEGRESDMAALMGRFREVFPEAFAGGKQFSEAITTADQVQWLSDQLATYGPSGSAPDVAPAAPEASGSDEDGDDLPFI